MEKYTHIIECNKYPKKKGEKENNISCVFRLRLSIIEEKKKSKRLVFYCYLLFFPLLHDDPIHNIFVFVQNVTKYLICNQYVPFPNINE